jgi:signal transduction histidine kinase
MKSQNSEDRNLPDPQPLKLLVIEDSDDDAELIAEELRRCGFAPAARRVQNAQELRTALEDDYEVIVSDYSLPQFRANDALRILRATGKDIPFIVVSGSAREAIIVDIMRAGARDYVMKENLTRLPLAVRRELEEARERRQHRQLEEQMRHAQRLESLGVLAGGVAHDFNNLLTGILGNVSLAMVDTPAGSRTRSVLENAVQAAEQAANLTRQMLAYAGKGMFFVEPMDIAAVVRGISALVSASVTKNISLIFDLQPNLPTVDVDRGQIQQLLMNFVTNAAEAIGQDQAGTIVVATGEQDLSESDLRKTVIRGELQPGRYVSVQVRDTGTGMEAETQGKIFDPFFTTKFTGRGLGLSAVLGIVRSHHGTIRVRSEPGKGSAFTVFLPARERVAPALPADPGMPEAIPPGVVLVIDDEETIRKTAKAILEKRGMRVFLAETGPAGVDTFRWLSDRLSLVLLDLTMPTMSGNEVLRTLRAIRPDVPIIISSGYSELDAMRRVNAGELAGFLQKPYTAAQLLQKVGAALEARVGAL